MWTLALLSALLAPQDATAPLTMDDVLGRVRWQGVAPAVGWAWDGEHLVVGRGEDERWYEVEGWREVAPVPEPRGEERPESPPRLRTRDGELVRLGPGKEGDLVLHSAQGELLEAHASPDQGWVSFVEDGDLKLVAMDGGEVRTLAGRAGKGVLEGLLDWVYQEEVYGRGDFQGHWWSPDSSHIAFLELDQSGVRSFPITRFDVPGVLETERGVELELMDYPKAGDPNPVTRLGIAEARTGEVRFLDLSAYPEDLLVVRVGWAPSGELEFVVQDRIQSMAALCLADPATGAVRELLRETSESWVDRPQAPLWLEDGSFLWHTHRSGYTHLERRAADGRLLNPVTSGEWRVRSLVAVDEQQGSVWFEGTRDGAIGRNVYRVGIDGSDLTRLTPGRGSHSVSFDAERRYLIDRVSSLSQPESVRLVDGITGEVLRELGAAEASADRAPRTPRLVAIRARDGYELDATVLLPERREGDRAPAVFLDTYSGPDAPSVSDRWRISTWHQFLAERGVLVLQVNVRSASGRGHAHTSTCYRQLGVQELADLEDAVAHVVAEYGADPARVAISGWSYGGFMAAYALTHSDRFALGFAGAGVHDWQLYDTIYTERYMSTPQDNPDGYLGSSVIRAAGDLSGHLVLMHGTIDDNVHLQNTMLLVDALQEAGKDSFELMLYPGARHGVYSSHRSRMLWRVLRERFALVDAAG
jgi:dipeptidyl-peptidase-4